MTIWTATAQWLLLLPVVVSLSLFTAYILNDACRAHRIKPIITFIFAQLNRLKAESVCGAKQQAQY